MKKIVLILILLLSVSVSYAKDNKCYFNCTTEVTEVTNVTNEYYLDDSSIQKAIAQTATLETLMPTAAGKTRFNVLGAAYDGEQAVGVTVIHRFQKGRTLEAGYSYGDKALIRLGGGLEF